MKRIMQLGAFLVALSLLFCACAGVPEKPNDSTGSTDGTETDNITLSITDTMTDSTEDMGVENATLSKEGQDAPVALNTEEDWQEFIKNHSWYVRALGCIFEKPEDIPAWFYFYRGVGDYAQATGEELAFILDAFQKKNPNTENLDYAHEYTRLPVAKMNEALTVLGVTVEDIQIPDRWVYYDKTDSYYFWVSDAYGVEGWYVTRVEKGTEGTVAVYWETKGYYWGDPAAKEPLKGAKMVLTMQQQPDGTYRILSNVPQT